MSLSKLYLRNNEFVIDKGPTSNDYAHLTSVNTLHFDEQYKKQCTTNKPKGLGLQLWGHNIEWKLA